MRDGVRKVIEAARAAAADPTMSGKQALADRWGISYQAIDKFDRQGWFPLDRAKQAEAEFRIPLRDLVRQDIRDALDSQTA